MKLFKHGESLMNNHRAGFLVNLAISACLSTLPLLAQAHHLAIANHTSDPLTFSVNNVCSKKFGTIYEYQIKTISETTLNKVCSNYNSPCVIMGYDGKNCSGKSMGGIKYLSKHTFSLLHGERKISVGASVDSLFFNESTT